MKKDLERILKNNKLDAIWVSGPMHNNPDMVYFTGIHNVGNADLFIIPGKGEFLFHSDMEREEAAKSGFSTISVDQKYPINQLVKDARGDLLQAYSELYKYILTEIGLDGKKIGIFGRIEIGSAFALIQSLQAKMPNTEFEGFVKDSPLVQIQITKDEQEVQAIRRMGKITTQVVKQVAEFLSNCHVQDKVLMDSEGKVTIGRVKDMINLLLAERGADNPETTIFSIGRDAGIPHNSGNPLGLLEIGKPIIFDIFPCEKGGGYFYDFTRTWCLGYAPAEVISLYEHVFSVHQEIIAELEMGELFSKYQDRTCQLFTERGHETIQSNPKAQEGYVHSIGHGLGLRVHESPSSGITANENDILQPGVVFTIEPGLYYPSKNMGVRIEDTIYLKPDGKFEILADYPYDLVIPTKH